MKIDKSTHMLILGAFVLIFVIIYLYMAITDIKRLKTEIQVLQKDLTTLLDSTKCILPKPKQEGMAVQTQCEFLPLPVLTPIQSMNKKVETPAPTLDDDDEELAAKEKHYQDLYDAEVLHQQAILDNNLALKDRAKKLESDIVEKYKEYDYPRGICIKNDGGYKLIDGYHRVAACNNNKIKMIIGNK